MTHPAARSGAALALDPASDADVVGDILAGSKDRFEVLLRRYNQRLFRVARSILRDDAEAEDAVQQAYLSAFTRLGSLDDPARFAGWVTRITVREAIRRRGKNPELSHLAAVPDRAADPPAPSPHDRVEVSELRVHLERALDALPEHARAVIVMRDVQEMTTRETADCLDLSEEAVRVRLHRARHALQRALQEQTDVALGGVFAFAGARCDRIARRVMAAIQSA